MAGVPRYIHRVCRLLSGAQELLDSHAGSRGDGFRQSRFGLGPVGRFDSLRHQQVCDGNRLRSQQCAGVHSAGSGRFGGDNDRHGSYSLERRFALHTFYVLHLVCKRLGARYGLASVRTGDGALVLGPRTWREDVDLERRPQHRRRRDGSVGRVGNHRVRPLERCFLFPRHRGRADSDSRLYAGARYSAVVRSAAYRAL